MPVLEFHYIVSVARVQYFFNVSLFIHVSNIGVESFSSCCNIHYVHFLSNADENFSAPKSIKQHCLVLPDYHFTASENGNLKTNS